MGILILWVVILVLAVVVEFATQQLVSIWFAAGAVGALVALACGVEGILIQAAIFLGISILLLLLARPVLHKLHDFPTEATNNDRNVGKLAVIVQAVDAQTHTGRVRLGDVEWIAESQNGEAIPVGTIVRVAGVNGARLLVEQNTGQEVTAIH